MATTILQGAVLCSAQYSGHYVALCTDGFTYDSVVRSGNTVTIKNCRMNKNQFGTNFSGGDFGWARTWYMNWQIGTGYSGNRITGVLGQTPSIKLSDYGWWGATQWYIFGTTDLYFGDISFTVNSGDTSKKLYIAGILDVGTNNGEYGYFTVTFPASNYALDVYASNAKFDVYINGTRVAYQVSSFYETYSSGTTYQVKNINPNSGYRLSSSTSTSYSGTLTGDKSITISTVRTYSFSWSCTNCTGDPYIGSSRQANDTNSYSTTVDSGSSLSVQDIRANSGYFFSDDNTTSKSNLTKSSATSNTSWSYSATACVAPSGGSIEPTARTWNSVTAKASLTAYGTPSNISTRNLRLFATDGSSTTELSPQTKTATTSATGVVFTHSKLIGCAPFKLGWAADNKGACTKNTTNSGMNGTLFYLPPHPLASASASTAPNETDITVTFKAKGYGADGVNNITGAVVNYQYRYSTDGGVTFTGWTTFATNETPDHEVTYQFNEDYNTNIMLQVRQVNVNDLSQASEAFTVIISPVHPKPKAPIIQNTHWDELNRTFTCQIKDNGSYGQSNAAVFDHFVYEMSYNPDYSDPFYSGVGYDPEWDVPTSYMKPNAKFYIRAKAWNNWGEESVWDAKELTVKRPTWGIATKNNVTVNIVDMIQCDTEGNFSQRDWIEGTTTGKNRLVKK